MARASLVGHAFLVRHHHPAVPTKSGSGATHQNRETKLALRLLLRIRIGVGNPIRTPLSRDAERRVRDTKVAKLSIPNEFT
jgi:hypothetical protein